jgi:hypothetical protein
VIHRGTDNLWTLDAEFADYEATMPWPEVEGNRITTPNGLVLDFAVPGEKVRISYRASDDRCSLDLELDAVTPLIARRRLMPGEEEHDDPARNPGGAEQFMHVTGTLELDGRSYDVDCFNARDRSWSQVRTETRAEVITPPVGWGPVYFDESLAFNQFGIEPADTNPAWKQLGLFPDVDPEKPSHHWAWVWCDGEAREVTKVRRNVTDRDPLMYMATAQEIEITDETGQTHFFEGEVVSATEVFGWFNIIGHDSVYRWKTEDGRIGHGPYQEVWHDAYQRAMTARYRSDQGPRSETVGVWA